MSLNVPFEKFGELALQAYIDSAAAAGVVKATLCMVLYDGTTDDEFIATGSGTFITTFDEMDGGYDQGFASTDRKTLTITADNAGGGGVVDLRSGVASTTFTALAVGTGNVEGIHVYDHLTSDALSTNICFCDFGGSVAANGQDFIVNWDAGNSQDMMRWTFTAA
jgi:hypothetical protein